MRDEPKRLSGSDEIDLFELLMGVWRQKLLILLVTAICGGGALAYALLARPIYEARVIVQPPALNDISPLNYGRGGSSGLGMLSVKDVYEIFLRNLQSDSLRRNFFQTVFLPSLSEAERKGSQDDLYNRFLGVLSLGVVTKDAPSRFYVKVDLPDPRRAAEWVVRYVEMAGQLGKGEIEQNLKSDAAAKVDSLEQEIRAARESARKQREDQIVQLSEALVVARSLGLDRPAIILNSLSGKVSAGMDGPLTYMRGSMALEAEIDNLRKRTSDDPFVPDLRQREEVMDFYRTLHIDAEAVRIYRQDGAIELPDRAVKPRRAVIVTLGLVVGFALGGLLAILRDIGTKMRQRELSF